MSRKRNREESEKKVSSVLNPSGEDLPVTAASEHPETSSDFEANKPKKPRLIRSFTGELIDEAKMEKLRKTKSRRSHLADEAENEEEDKYFDRLEKKEAMEEKMINTTEVKAKVVSCAQCGYTAYTQSDLCKTKGKSQLSKSVRFFFQFGGAIY